MVKDELLDSAQVVSDPLDCSLNREEPLPHIQTRNPWVKNGPYADTMQYIQRNAEGLQAVWDNLKIYSAFQPIVSLNHAKVVGYEALMRPFTLAGTPLSPLTVLNMQTKQNDAIFLDRLCRTLHLHAFNTFSSENHWIFINISPQTIIHGSHYGEFFLELLEQSGIPPHRIVIEILETPTSEERELSEAIQFYKELGCLVAIDDFGTGHSNFHRIWRLKPNIVKLDRTIIASAVTDSYAARILPGMVGLLHEAGCLVQVEGVETEAEAYATFNSGADLAQGWYFAKPKREIEQDDTIKHKISQLHERHRNLSKINVLDTLHKPQLIALEKAAYHLVPKQTFTLQDQAAIQDLMLLPGAERCYLLNEYGYQVGQSVVNDDVNEGSLSQYAPIAYGNDANWAHRPYMKRALAYPGVVQVTRPYLSIATAQMCCTLSLAFRFNGSTHVLCLDLIHNEQPQTK